MPNRSQSRRRQRFAVVFTIAAAALFAPMHAQAQAVTGMSVSATIRSNSGPGRSLVREVECHENIEGTEILCGIVCAPDGVVPYPGVATLEAGGASRTAGCGRSCARDCRTRAAITAVSRA